MLAEYEEQVFNAEVKGDSVKLWKYTSVENFDKRQDGNIVYYEKDIPRNEIKMLFSINFYTFIGDKNFVIDDIKDNELKVICNDGEYALSHSFKEFEHGLWSADIPAEKFDKLLMIKCDEYSDRKIVSELNFEQLKKSWQKYVVDMCPPRN